MPSTERQKMSPARLFSISLILLCATISSPSGAVGQTISVAAVGPTRVDFGPQVSATTSERRLIILANAGSDALPIALITKRGDFAVAHDCPGLLPAGEECRIWVSFKPSGEGVREGQLTITDEAGTQRVALLGTGTPVLEASQK
ncbi:MAG: choice-of-anchor D domain-containing protein [Candidatus Sulfotelmatobacter sp.]